MERSFIRMQMLAKLEEFCFYTEKYIQELNKERKLMSAELNESELQEFDELSQQIIDFKHSNSEIINELDIIAVRLTVLHNEYVTKHNSKIIDLKARLTNTYDEITIIMRPLPYSTFAAAAGYSEEHQLMDLEFSSGKVYRYSKVPKELFEKIITKGSMKGLRQELNNFEFVIIKEN
jgi:hypothetical protein